MDGETPESSTKSRRILIVSEDSDLALALQVTLGDHGNTVRWEANPRHAHQTAGEFRPAVMLTASASAVFVGSPHSPEIFDLPRPVDAARLVVLVESLLVAAGLCESSKASSRDPEQG